jgi:hypothetical protein
MVPSTDFWIGFVVAGFIGFLAFQFGVWVGEFNMRQRQVVKHTTDKTPLQIVITGLFRALVAIVILILGVAVLLLIPMEESMRMTLLALFAVFVLISLLIASR